MQQPRAVFRVPLGRTLTVVALCLLASAVGGLIVASDWPTLLRSMPILLLAGVATWNLFWRPRVIVDDSLVTIINVARTWQIPLVAIEDMEVRYGVTLDTKAGRVTAWAASAPGRHEALRLGRGDFAPQTGRGRVERIVRPAEATSTESGAAAFVITQRWKDAPSRQDANAGNAHDTVRTWHLTSLIVVVALALAAALTLAFV